MKRLITIGICLGLTSSIYSQQTPTGSPVPGGYTTAQQAASAWYRGGNLMGNTGGSNNLLGTAWNSPLYFITGGTGSANYRTKLNANFTSVTQYTINGYGSSLINTSGYLLLGVDGTSITDNANLYAAKGAFSLLHLNGATASNSYQEYGYRPWMKTGLTFTEPVQFVQKIKQKHTHILHFPSVFLKICRSRLPVNREK